MWRGRADQRATRCPGNAPVGALVDNCSQRALTRKKVRYVNFEVLLQTDAMAV